MSVRTSRCCLLALVALGVALAIALRLAPTSAAAARHAARHAAGGCPDTYPAARDPANPLDLPAAPGPDPLHGARFSVAGPRDGMAARAIAKLLGVNPNRYASWPGFLRALRHGRLHRKLARNPALARRVRLLEKIAGQPVGVMISRYSGGGRPGAIYAITRQLVCGATRADPGSIPIINTYFLYQAGYCETTSEIVAHRRTFARQVSEMTHAIGRHPAVMLLEMDAIGSSGCMARNGALPAWEANIRYEIDKVAALPHTVVYIEGGYSDGANAAYTARVLRAVGVARIRGFYTNDTHINWTIKEIRWGETVSRLAGGTHFVVNTSDSGRGPLLNAHPATQGVEQLCNPPGRGAGPPPTTTTGFPHVDAFLWIHVPGESSGTCHGGTASGTFWLARTLTEASNANARLGPALPSLPF
jgi:endoglucanase